MGDRNQPNSVYPNQIDRSGESLITAPDATASFTPCGVLQLGISPVDTTIRVVGIDLSKVPDRGIVTIGEEQIRYMGLNVELQELYVPDDHLRGFGGTTAAHHLAGAQVLWLMTSQHLKSIHTAIEAVQEHIGVRGSTDPSTIEYRLAALREDIEKGLLEQEEIELTEEMINQKFLQLSCGAKAPDKVLMFVVGGGTMDNGEDFNVSLTTPAVVGWAGLTLDGILAASDKLLFVYEQKV